MKKLTLRLSDTLHEALKELSEQENRSLHGEIVYRLKRAIESTYHNAKKGVLKKEWDYVE